MKKNFMIKLIAISVASFFLLTFISGLIGRVSFGIIMLRSFLFALFGGILAGGSYFIAVKFLDMEGFNPFPQPLKEENGMQAKANKKNFEAVSQSSPADYEVYTDSEEVEPDLLQASAKPLDSQERAQKRTQPVADLSNLSPLETGGKQSSDSPNEAFTQEMDELDNLADDFAAAENAPMEKMLDMGIRSSEDEFGLDGGSSPLSKNTSHFGDDVRLEEIGGPESSMEDYAKVVRTMLKKGE